VVGLRLNHPIFFARKELIRKRSGGKIGFAVGDGLHDAPGHGSWVEPNRKLWCGASNGTRSQTSFGMRRSSINYSHPGFACFARKGFIK
jgi:hypothetical protein